MRLWELNCDDPTGVGLRPCHSLTTSDVEPGLSEYAVEAWERQTLNSGVYSDDFRDDPNFWPNPKWGPSQSTLKFLGYHSAPCPLVMYIGWPKEVYYE